MTQCSLVNIEVSCHCLDESDSGVRIDVDGMLDDAAVGTPVGGGSGCRPAQMSPCRARSPPRPPAAANERISLVRSKPAGWHVAAAAVLRVPRACEATADVADHPRSLLFVKRALEPSLSRVLSNSCFPCSSKHFCLLFAVRSPPGVLILIAPPATMIHSRADRCINQMIMVGSAASTTMRRRQPLAVVVTVAKGYDLDYVWKNQGQPGPERSTGGYYINAAQAGEPPGRWWGPGAAALGLRPRRGGGTQAIQSGLRADRPPYRREARQATRQLREVRRPPGPADGRRAACDRRTAHRAGTPSGPGHPPARRLHRRDGLVQQVDLGTARLDQGERPAGAASRRRAGGGVLDRAGGEVPGRLAPGEPRCAGVRAAVGRA